MIYRDRKKLYILGKFWMNIFNNKKPGTNKDDNEKPKFYENVFSGSTIDVEA